MATLQKIDSALFPNLYQAFLKDDDPLSTEQDWRNVFDYQWETEEGYCGYAMLDQERVVGMIGMVFRDRMLNGTQHKVCNLHTWWVHEDYRGQSLLLLRPILKMQDHTVTHFTPCDKVRAISRRLGFHDISTQLKILLPPGDSRSRRRAAEDAITYDLQEIAPSLSEHDRQLFNDHLPYHCGHLLFRSGNADCYVLYTCVIRHRLPYCHIHYFSNRAIFAANEPVIRASLLRKHNVRFAALDTRLVPDMRLDRSFDFWAPVGGLYKPCGIEPEQIDNLYSDIVFLKLTTLPTISHELKKLVASAWSRVSPRRQGHQQAVAASGG